jgi:putative flippase GtrA
LLRCNSEHRKECDTPRVSVPDSLATRALRFGRAVIVGSSATFADFSIFTACVRVLGVAPGAARLPALLAGACFQFFGNRTFTFRAQAGSVSRQARLFVLAEGVTLALNFGIFRLLARSAPTVAPELVSLLGTFLVFVTFAYPMRRLVIFRLPTPPAHGENSE